MISLYRADFSRNLTKRIGFIIKDHRCCDRITVPWKIIAEKWKEMNASLEKKLRITRSKSFIYRTTIFRRKTHFSAPKLKINKKYEEFSGSYCNEKLLARASHYQEKYLNFRLHVRKQDAHIISQKKKQSFLTTIGCTSDEESCRCRSTELKAKFWFDSSILLVQTRRAMVGSAAAFCFLSFDTTSFEVCTITVVIVLHSTQFVMLFAVRGIE